MYKLIRPLTQRQVKPSRLCLAFEGGAELLERRCKRAHCVELLGVEVRERRAQLAQIVAIGPLIDASSTNEEIMRDIVAGRTLSISASAVTEIRPCASIVARVLSLSGVMPVGSEMVRICRDSLERPLCSCAAISRG